ncbi:MAG TPA: ABC transporter permease [Saprospiraceae bacterium]|nr:ABC transporter permease [Saprospiraceae bacterium]
MKKTFLYIVLISVLIFMWEVGTKNNSNLRLLISSPSNSFSYFKSNFGFLIEALKFTALESIVGLVFALLISFVFMYVCLRIPKLFDFILPVMIVSQVIPVVTLAPLFIVLFGIGLISKIAMAILMCFFPIFISLASGIKSIDENYKNLFSIYNAKPNTKIVKLYLPFSLPFLFSGLKVSSTLAVIGSIVAEFSGAEYGLGKNLFLSSKRLDAELMINSILLSCLLGGLFYLLIVIFERYFGKWYLKNSIN